MSTGSAAAKLEGPLSRADVERHLAASRIPIRLAGKAESGWPFVVSLWFVPLDGALWCATIEGAGVLDGLRHDPACAFEVAGDEPPYRGVRGWARARLHPDRGAEVLERLIERYLGDSRASLARWLRSRAEREVAIELVPVRLVSWDFSERMR